MGSGSSASKQDHRNTTEEKKIVLVYPDSHNKLPEQKEVVIDDDWDAQLRISKFRVLLMAGRLDLALDVATTKNGDKPCLLGLDSPESLKYAPKGYVSAAYQIARLGRITDKRLLELLKVNGAITKTTVVDKKDARGTSAIRLAYCFEKLENDPLVQSWFAYNSPDPNDGATPLVWFLGTAPSIHRSWDWCDNRALYIVSHMTDAALRTVDRGGNTALFLAVKHTYPRTVKELLKRWKSCFLGTSASQEHFDPHEAKLCSESGVLAKSLTTALEEQSEILRSEQRSEISALLWNCHATYMKHKPKEPSSKHS